MLGGLYSNYLPVTIHQPEPALHPDSTPQIANGNLRKKFWERYQLHELNRAEWEALCDGCGLCCLVKLEDEDTGEVVYTKVACKLLDTQTAQCSDYPNRKKFVPDCLQLNAELVPQLHWLPKSCAYKRLHLGKTLPDWHPLLTGKAQSDIPAKKSAAKRCISEKDIDADAIEEYVVKWVR